MSRLPHQASMKLHLVDRQPEFILVHVGIHLPSVKHVLQVLRQHSSPHHDTPSTLLQDHNHLFLTLVCRDLCAPNTVLLIIIIIIIPRQVNFSLVSPPNSSLQLRKGPLCSTSDMQQWFLLFSRALFPSEVFSDGQFSDVHVHVHVLRVVRRLPVQEMHSSH